MKSVKPGRGPSMMGGVGSVGVAIGGVIWMFATASMGAPPFFTLFGVVFIGIAIVQAVYHFKNATGENRMSVFDITEHEPDPLDSLVKSRSHISKNDNLQNGANDFDLRPNNFCPNCGENVAEEKINYCPGCGQAVR